MTRFEEVSGFLEDVGGFAKLDGGDGVAMFRGARSNFDLLLVSEKHAGRKGLCGIAFLIEDEEDLLRSRAAVTAKGIPTIASLDLPHKRNVVVTDPDGLNIEFYSIRGDAKPALPKPGGAAWMYSA